MQQFTLKRSCADGISALEKISSIDETNFDSIVSKCVEFTMNWNDIQLKEIYEHMFRVVNYMKTYIKLSIVIIHIFYMTEFYVQNSFFVNWLNSILYIKNIHIFVLVSEVHKVKLPLA